ncbi:MAG: sugar transferase, partial [Rhodoferax sp.]
MSKAPSALSAAALRKRAKPTSLGADNLLSLFETFVGPISFILSLWSLAFYYEGTVPSPYLILSILVFALSFPGRMKLQSLFFSEVLHIAVNWVWLAGMLLIIGFASGYIYDFSRPVIAAWLWAAPLSKIGACLLLRGAAPFLLRLQGSPRRAIIVGMNDQGLALANKISDSPYSRLELVGFVDDRSASRLDATGPHKLLGDLDQLLALIHRENIQIIYLSLPMTSQPRILHILDELKDTTTSIYFVPDMFVTDLIQSHPDSVCGMPVISVCESPFQGMDGAAKRLSDLVLGSLILLLIMPLLLIIAIAVKTGSPGPIIFQQRRCGEDGKEIVIYKFRSMTVTEDGDTIEQARQNDARVTPLGAFLRRTS